MVRPLVNATGALTWILLILGQCLETTSFGFGKSRLNGPTPPSPVGAVRDPGPLDMAVGGDFILQSPSSLSRIYAVALSELGELESEPLCHRTAARLLVNDCALLDGTEKPALLTDNGRKVLDFIFSYSASLAICDLERGGFETPPECSRFREPALAALPVGNGPALHVSTAEVDACLRGLAKSASAWNTWVSYRMKAHYFCEAARADTEKTQSIRLHQRLTQILTRLTDGVDAERQARQSQVNIVSEGMSKLSPVIERIQADLAVLEGTVSSALFQQAQSKQSVQGGLEDALRLEEVLSTLFQFTAAQTANMTHSHEKAIQEASRKVNSEVELVMATMSSAFTSSVLLRDQLADFQQQIQSMSQKQIAVEENVVKVLAMAGDLSSEYESHKIHLNEAKDATSAILKLLEATGSFVMKLHTMLSWASDLTRSLDAIVSWTSNVTRSLWDFVTTILPCLLVPIIVLKLGSYQLPPSNLRNVCLLLLGSSIVLAFR